MEQKLGRYIIEDQLGEGSFAWVYRGYDEELERHVALKVLKPIWMSDPQAVARFKQEARTMAKLHHPNIAVVYEVGEAEGQVFLAQFLVNGNTLAARLKETGPMSWPQMMEILRPVASALDFAHENGIIHRDIKPANILVDDKGQAYLGDFGLVRAAEGSVQLSASAGGMIGTPAYMAPEQWEDREITPATDVYALSCVAVEMLTGKMLFDGSTPATVMKQHLMEGPRFPDQWPEGVPDHVVEVLKRGLAEHTTDRISSAGALVAELERAEAGEEVVAAPTNVAAEATEMATEPVETAVAEPEVPPEPVETAVAEPEPGPVPAATSTPAAAPPAKKSGKPILAIVGVAVVLLVIVCGVGLFLLPDEESEPIEGPAAAAQVAEAEEAPTEPPAVVAEPTEDIEPEPTEVANESDEDPYEIADRGWASFDAGNFGDAMAEFDLAIELDPNNADFYDGRGWAFYLLEEYDLALADLDQAIELDSNVPAFHTDRGVVHNSLGEFELALADFDQALALEPDEFLLADTLMNLGIALEGVGAPEDALATYQEAIDAYQAAGAPNEDYAHIEARVAELMAEEPAPALPGVDISTEPIIDILGLEGEILLEERFDNNQRDWFTGSIDDEYGLLQVDLIDGHYRVSQEAKDAYVWTRTIAGEEFDDFVASIDAMPLEYNAEFAYGLIFREDPKGNYYLLQINSSDRDNAFSVWLWDNQNQEWNILVDHTSMRAINNDAPNQLAVKAVGPELSFFINGQEATTIEDDSLQQGTVGVYFENFQAGDQATIDFDNLVVYGLSEP